MLLTFLHQLPDVAILALVVGVLTFLAAFAPVVTRLVLRGPRDTDLEDAAFEGYKAVVGMVGVVLAFSLVQVNGNLQTIETLVGKEGTAIAAVDRILVRSGEPDLMAQRTALTNFGTAVVQREWPLLASGDRSPDADAAYTILSRGVRANAPSDIRQQSIFAELLKQMDDLSELREEVIAASDIALPDFFWITTGGLLLVSLILAALTAPSLKQRVGVAAAAAAVSLLLTFVIIVDRPFEGQTSVSPKPIQKALDRNSRRAQIGFGSQHAAALPAPGTGQP